APEAVPLEAALVLLLRTRALFLELVEGPFNFAPVPGLVRQVHTARITVLPGGQLILLGLALLLAGLLGTFLGRVTSRCHLHVGVLKLDIGPQDDRDQRDQSRAAQADQASYERTAPR